MSLGNLSLPQSAYVAILYLYLKAANGTVVAGKAVVTRLEITKGTQMISTMMLENFSVHSMMIWVAYTYHCCLITVGDLHK